jgi:hypothetical protein
MYTLYADKQKVFECKVEIFGAKLSNSKVRLVLESKDVNLLFHGNIKSDGSCQIPISKLGQYLSESDTGKLRLEVIAEDTMFYPWEDSFAVKISKKVTTEVINRDEPEYSPASKKVAVTIVKQENESFNAIVKTVSHLIESDKALNNNLTKEKIYKLLETKLKRNKLNKSTKDKLVEAIYKNSKK